ncbi:MAG: hypothetical protein GPJ54_01370 [Candidatus Heimdallarchaeota archaeon]|nr:hypothetical protein [Candidatus Heimdallarchaeota archaeon]
MVETTTESAGASISTTIPVDTEAEGINNELVSWTQLGSSDLLAERTGLEMVYYESASVYILFGGVSEDSIYGDTLMFNHKTSTWTNITPAISPKPRFFHSMIYDSAADKIILFAGASEISGSNSSVFGDLWVFDYLSNTWTERFPTTSPDPRFYSSMIYDVNNEKTILFGGSNGDIDYFDTWGYDYGENSWQFLTVNNLTQFTVGTEAVYDSKREKMVVIGGQISPILFGLEAPIESSNMGFWIFDYNTNSWVSEITNSGPLNGLGHSIIFDANNDQIVLYGGYDSVLASGGTWVFDYSTALWQLQSSTLSDSYVFGSLIYNLEDKNAIYIGGLKVDESGDFIFTNEVWELSTSDHVNPNEDLTFPTLNPWFVGIVLTSIVSFASIGLFLKTKSILGKTSQLISGNDLAHQLPKNTKNIIGRIFGSSADSYYIIGANFISKRKISTELDKVIPHELYDYKFLLHPMRLAMCRILIEHTTVATKKLREMMGLSWSDLSTHTRAMKDKNLIHIEESTEDGKFVQVISLEPLGVINYQKLTQILLEVIDESLLFETYLKEIGDNSPSGNN